MLMIYIQIYKKKLKKKQNKYFFCNKFKKIA